jgi:DNA-binding transcriptional LysR family regulator
MSSSLLRTRLFVAVYEERSFTAAANREFSTQPGVSQHIQKLEDELGVKLFYREAGSVAPTPAGDAYYAACQQVLKAHEEANRVARAYGGGVEGEISVGVTPTTAAALLAPTLANFIRKSPNVSVRVVEAYSAGIVEQVAGGVLDFAIVPAGVDNRAVHTSLFARTPELLVSAHGFGLAPFKPVRLQGLGPLKMIFPSSLQSRRQHLDRYVLASNAHVERKLELDTMFGTLHLVEHTDWVTILPGIMMIQELRGGRLRVNTLAGPPLLLEIFEIHPARKALSPAALAFLEELRAEAARLEGEIASSLAPPD